MPIKPCKECPFKKDSTPGWLGGFTSTETRTAALSEGEFDCHLTRGNDKPEPCVGRLLFASKACKMFRDKGLEKLRVKVKGVNDSSEILGVMEFTDYHEREKQS